MNELGSPVTVKEERTVDEDRLRADVYRLLAVLLARPPDAETLALLREIEPGDGSMSDAWSELRQKAREGDPAHIEDEYLALFIGLGRGELNPYASWYLTGYLMEKPLARLRTELSELGIVRREGVCEPEDHAAALCESMALVISRDGLTFNRCKGFYEAYVGSWMDRFFADLEGASAADFFRAVGTLGSTFMGIERAYYSMPT